MDIHNLSVTREWCNYVREPLGGTVAPSYSLFKPVRWTERWKESRRKTQSKDTKQRRDFSLYEPRSCRLAARRHLTLTLFVPTTPKVNDFTHYCKWILVFTLDPRCNEYSGLLLLSGCPEVRLYVKIKLIAHRVQRRITVLVNFSDYSLGRLLTMQPACACACKGADMLLFTGLDHL